MVIRHYDFINSENDVQLKIMMQPAVVFDFSHSFCFLF